MSDSPRAKRAEREARLAEALRDNLRRRKEQARARAGERDPAPPSDAQQRDTDPTG